MRLLKFKLPLFLFFLASLQLAQNNFSTSWSNIESELVKWDSVRGKWIAESVQAISENRELPQRNFSEDFTPFELLKMVPTASLNRINVETDMVIKGCQIVDGKMMLMKSMLQKLNCNFLLGRSYGDPHISTFDKSNYSFQTAGEFTLLNLNNGYLEVQCRQKPQNENFSFNTAVAIRVAGDKIGLYASDGPVSNVELRINGSSYIVGSTSFPLPHGGCVRFNEGKYFISAPSGEVITLEIKNWRGGFGFINVNVQVFSCDKASVKGLLGNANGETDDDFITASRRPTSNYSAMFGNSLVSKLSAQAERQYLTYLANEFADQWRVTNENSLFEYPQGKNTLSFTDRTFPRAHVTLNDLTPSQQTQARKTCEENGVAEEDLRGCIFDQGFLSIDPSPRTPVPDFTKGVTLGRTEQPAKKKVLSETPIINNTVNPSEVISPKNNTNQIGNLPLNILQKNKVLPQIKSAPNNNAPAPGIKTTPGTTPFKSGKGK
jgi:von Willebrand factor type D domain